MFAAMNLAGYTASEADDLRKAIAKKIKAKLHKHRDKFIKGAVKNGIQQETAQAIFDDWEEFARYGFNKSHAVDYGVISVQTAYLKTHYPVEYMTAVLSTNKNDSDKVALYVADCRRMGIAVEPPDVNASEWDFSIEDHKDGPVIRFGLGAVKNVGQGPVDAILLARDGEPFEDLNSFARRVDLRQVGKRALESLVRVGALDSFGPRLAILETLERIIAVSASHFRAVEMGQMSLFGEHTGVIEEISLPRTTSEISRREVLNWERELIGLYVSDHPLSPVMDVLNKTVTHFSGQLSEANSKERVRVAGLITRIRHHQTRSGKPMGFVTIEDLQGTIELVIFPRTWNQYLEIIDYDKIVLVDGKVDADGAEPKILVDSISTEFSMTTSLDSPLERSPQPPGESGYASPNQEHTDRVSEEPQDYKSAAPDVDDELEEDDDWDMAGMPPPPDTFPDDWGLPADQIEDLEGDTEQETEQEEETDPTSSEAVQKQPSPREETPPTVSQEKVSEVPAVIAVEQRAVTIVDSQAEAPPPAVQAPPKMEPGTQQEASESQETPRYLVSPGASQPSGDQVYMVTVVLRSTGDKTRDVLRLRRIHGIITSFPGNDRFAFHLFERGRGYLLEFPNFTAGICPEMLERVTNLIGADNVKVESITFQ